MAITKAAKKAMRVAERRRRQNNQNKKILKALLKQAKGLIAEQKTDGAKVLLPKIYQALDKAAQINIIKKNTASRKKSRLAMALNKSGLA